MTHPLLERYACQLPPEDLTASIMKENVIFWSKNYGSSAHVAGRAQWCDDNNKLVHRHLQLEKPCDHTSGPLPLFHSCLVPRASTSHTLPVHVPDWGMELSVPSSSTSIHGCQTLSRGAYR